MCSPTALACCACSAACSACGSCTCKDAGRGSKLIYMIYMVISVVVALIMKVYGNEAVLNLPGFEGGCVNGTVKYPTHSEFDSLACAGNQVVYRFSLGLVVFFAIMIVGSLASRLWHVGLWGIKTLLWIAATVGVFFVPNSFYLVYADIARVISVVFLVMQVVILFSFAFEIHELLLEKAAQADRDAGVPDDQEPVCGNCWRVLYLVAGFGCFVAALVGCGFMFAHFSCGLGYAFCSLTVILVLVVLAVTLGSQHAKGVLPGGVIALYVTYLCFAALTSHPEARCNPTVNSNAPGAIVLGVLVAALSLAYTSWSAARSVAHMFSGPDAEEEQEAAPAFADSSRKAALMPDDEGGRADALAEEGAAPGRASGAPASPSRSAADAEANELPVDRRDRVIFHVIMSMGAWYMAMLLTNWAGNAGLENQSANFEASMESLWVKIVSQWIAFLLFCWTVVAPSCCPNREFG